MSDDLYARAKAVFQDAMERPRGERGAFVASACGGDEELRREVDSLVAASDRAGAEFLDPPSLKMCATCDGTFSAETKFCPHCGQPLRDDPRALVGTRLDNLYQIEELLGQGGMGAVYRARHVLLGDFVAVKTLKRELGDSPAFLKRFQREGQAARSFRHPNAVVVHDLRTTPGGMIYMVLEYIEGENLRRLLRDRGRLSPAEAVELLEPIASALDAAHSRGVVHRDMKPENVMLGRGESGPPTVKVLDLGIAKLRVEAGAKVTTELTTAGQLLGTPHYMSPEQWGAAPRDDGREVDGRADVYSLGVMAFEMVTGDWPYRGKTLEEYRRAHLSAEVPLAHAACPQVPERFGLAVARALAKDRADRWPTPGAFVAELKVAVRACDDATLKNDATATAVAGGDLTIADPRSVPPGPDAARPAGPASAPAERREAPPEAREAPAPPRRRAVPAAAAGVLLALGAVGLWAWTAYAPGPAPSAPATVASATPETKAIDALRFEVELLSKGGATSRVSGESAIGRVGGYRFVFTPAVAGRLALIGPNERNVPTLFLPVAGAAPLAPGAPLTFPDGNWFHTTGDTPSDTVTVVFIPDGAVTPAFVAGRAGRQLSVDEQRDLAHFVESYRVAPRFGGAGSVLAAAGEGRPLAADLTIRY